MMKRAFTLIELLLVVAIMGLMGTLSVGGFRAMRNGMEQRSVVRNVSQFIRNAYQRAEIDRQTTAVFFWNEVRREESDDGTETLIVVGRAVAVRLSGRISDVDSGSKMIYDEFGDLGSLAANDDDGVENAATTYIYRMSGDSEGGSWEDCRCEVASVTDVMQNSVGRMSPMLVSGGDKDENDAVAIYGYYLPDGIDSWKRGDQYGFEIADLTLPNNYIFGTDLKTKMSDSPWDAGSAMWFYPTGVTGSGSSDPVTISAVRPGKTGEPEAKPLSDKTENPKTN